MGAKRVSVLVGILVLGGCDRNDPVQPRLVADLVSDVTPPTLTAFDFTPKSINTTAGSADVTVDFTVTDDLSGATQATVLFDSPSGLARKGNGASFASTTSQSGSFTVTFPQFSEAGIWKVSLVQLCDAVGNCRNLSTSDLTALAFPTDLSVQNTIPVSIDIKPGSGENTLKLSKRGKVTVAVLSDARFEAPLRVARTSLTFGHSGNEASLVSCAREGEDVNGDGLSDLVCQFYVQLAGFQVGDVEGVLRGRTADQIPIEGRDVVRILK